MLKLLHIENIAVIEKADIEFSAGFNVLTGETGAGKSIVIDALGAVLGGRVTRELVRYGADSALVTAVFEAENAADWCEENGIEAEDGELFLMRRITAEGKSSCRVCGVPVSVTQLKSLGERLLDIHGQNDGQRLLDEKNHRLYLDRYGAVGDEFAAYQAAYDAYTATKKEIDALSIDEGEKERRIDSLRQQIAELEEAAITPGEIEEKTARRDLLVNSEKLTEAVNDAFYALYGGDHTEGAVSLIGEAERSTQSAARYSDFLEDMSKRLTDLKYAADDISESLRDFKNSLDFSPMELDNLETRLSKLKKLSRKYGDTEQDMLDYLESARDELDGIEYSGERLIKLNAELKKRETAALEAAEKLSKKRKSAALKLGERIKTELEQLSMKGVRFEVRFEKTAQPLTASGFDEVSFLMSANAGEAPGRISHIASGGELSRIMLAMKNVIAENDDIGAMVFDEIDAGVSGIAAQRVGEKISELSRYRQVICVTHLAQIAVMADNHFVIEKNQQDGRTYTSITTLDYEGRKLELARLTGGENITELTLASAEEQLANAVRYKSDNS